MRKYIIMSIQDIVDSYDKIKYKKTFTIFLTKKEYPFAPTLRLGFDDVFKDGKGFIEDYQIKSIHDALPILKDMDTIIVGCDAGLSRSPAIALAIATLLEDKEVIKDIRYRYEFLNYDVFDAIMEYRNEI